MPDLCETAQVLRVKARRCRRLAEAVWHTEVERRLLQLATEFDKRAVAEEARTPA